MTEDPTWERLRARVGTPVNAKYKLDALLGFGGMAAVYAATHRNGDRVALKVLHTELSRLDSIRERFLREGYVANKIGHAGCVRVIDDEIAADGSVYLVMELLEGQTLEQLRHQAGGKLPVGDAVAIVGDVLEILGAAHAQRIVHRDIKPDNVFITHRGVTKLMDFGIARLLDSAQATASGAFLGTPAFMPPEQATGRNKEVDARSDLWSTGALLFVLLSGQEVHAARSAAEQMIFAATEPARSIGTLVPDLDPDLVHIVDVALAFDPKGRWQTAGAMRNALRYAVGRLSAEAPEPRPGVNAFAATAVASAPAGPTAPTLIHGSGEPDKGSR